MIILAVETSCDETAVAISRDGREILADAVLSQVDMHEVYGGVVPEIASRKHIEVITGLADTALKQAGIGKRDIDAVAVTYAPGLIGALLVGVGFAKSTALALSVPLIPVHHIKGHVAANYIAHMELEPPFAALIVSGGHSLILDVLTYTDMRIMGMSRDDAAGECFDKVARVMGMGYPGGAALDKLARTGDDTMYSLPRAKISGAPLEMSFSGLKTAVVNIVHNSGQKNEAVDIPSLCASFEAAVSDTLVPRAMEALKILGYKRLVIAGGVAANTRVRRDLESAAASAGAELFMPPLSLCGDNGSMIACQAYYEYMARVTAGLDLNAYATRSVEARFSS